MRVCAHARARSMSHLQLPELLFQSLLLLVGLLHLPIQSPDVSSLGLHVHVQLLHLLVQLFLQPDFPGNLVLLLLEFLLELRDEHGSDAVRKTVLTQLTQPLNMDFTSVYLRYVLYCCVSLGFYFLLFSHGFMEFPSQVLSGGQQLIPLFS